MRRVLPAIVALALLVPARHQVAAAPRVAAVGIEAVASGLEFPAGMAFLPSGRIVYGERFTGEIRFYNLNSGGNPLVFTIPNVATAGEQGLLGVAVPPDYPNTPYLYAYVTRLINGTPENQIVRIRVANGVGQEMGVMVRITAGNIHNGGAMVFHPSGSLHVGTGEVGVPSNAQNTRTLTGKVLRLTNTGARHPSNALGNRVFSYGHRNIFGIAIDPQTGGVWITENGPACNDEINKPVNGVNFGWGPSQECGAVPDAEDTNRDGPAPRFPARIYNPTIAPTGAVFCQGCGLGSATEGTLLFGAWNDGAIRRLTLNPARTDTMGSTVLYDHSSGVLALARAPDGRIYFTDSDQIFRLVP
jgi:glucose/arabinose dehydrogenase